MECENCGDRKELSKVLQSEELPYPYHQTHRVFLKCDSCGKEKHCYYLPEYVRFVQSKLNTAVREWNDTRTPEAYQEYSRWLRSFRRRFDKAQKDYQRIVVRDLGWEEDSGG